MSTLTIVRHGQASLFAEDYDRLSALGERQAAALGDYWTRTGTVFERAYAGPARRHLQTAALAGWPEPIVVPELDEFPAMELTRRYLPQLSRENPRMAALAEELRRATDPAGRARSLEFLFEAFTTMWVRGEFDASELETWEMFSARVARGFDQVRNHGAKGARVVVFSSAGPTALMAQAALGLDSLKTLHLCWLVRNAALSEFLFSGERFSMASFNGVPHLEAGLVTYR
jgi:broad specificity phosphatase PhoE